MKREATKKATARAKPARPRKTLEQIRREQGVQGPANFEHLTGTEFWKTDQEFEAFLEFVRRSRHDG